MNSKNLLIGIACIISGIALFAAYDQFIRPEREAREIMAEAKIVIERGDKDSINQAIGSYTKIIVHYPSTKSAPEAYLLMGGAYEKLGLYRLAYLRYSYLLKPPLAGKINEDMRMDVIARLAKLKMLRSYTEEGLNQLYTLLNSTQNTEFRSRIYSELGQAYLRNGDVARAKNSYEIAIQENSSNEEAILGKARVCIRSGSYEDAFSLYDYFLKYFGSVSPYTPDVKNAYLMQLYNAGLSAYRAGNFNRSIDLMNRFVQKFGDSKYSANALYWIGESYFSLKQFDRAISSYDRVFSKDFHQKDEDARIKKGYAYFMSKRFDLAAKEFQTYMKDFPRGKYADEAKTWKEMSSQELRFRIEKAKLPETSAAEIEQDSEQGKEHAAEKIRKHEPAVKKEDSETPQDTDNSGKEPVSENSHGDEEVSGVAGTPLVQLDNVTEL